ncbi:hypothetical protein RFI_39832, partial [Reticulomyxa filosa]
QFKLPKINEYQCIKIFCVFQAQPTCNDLRNPFCLEMHGAHHYLTQAVGMHYTKPPVDAVSLSNGKHMVNAVSNTFLSVAKDKFFVCFVLLLTPSHVEAQSKKVMKRNDVDKSNYTIALSKHHDGDPMTEFADGQESDHENSTQRLALDNLGSYQLTGKNVYVYVNIHTKKKKKKETASKRFSVSNRSFLGNQHLMLHPGHTLFSYFDKKLQLTTFSSSMFDRKMIIPLIIRYPFCFQNSHFIMYQKDLDGNNFMMRMAKCCNNVHGVYPFPNAFKKQEDKDSRWNAKGGSTDKNTNSPTLPENDESANSQRWEDYQFKMLSRHQLENPLSSKLSFPALDFNCAKTILSLVPFDVVERQLKEEVNDLGFNALMTAVVFQHDPLIIQLFVPKQTDANYWEMVEPNNSNSILHLALHNPISNGVSRLKLIRELMQDNTLFEDLLHLQNKVFVSLVYHSFQYYLSFIFLFLFLAKFGQTSLMYACFVQEHIELKVLEMLAPSKLKLIEKKEFYEQTDFDGNTLLHLAIKNPNPNCLSRLRVLQSLIPSESYENLLTRKNKVMSFIYLSIECSEIDFQYSKKKKKKKKNA